MAVRTVPRFTSINALAKSRKARSDQLTTVLRHRVNNHVKQIGDRSLQPFAKMGMSDEATPIYASSRTSFMLMLRLRYSNGISRETVYQYLRQS